MSHKKHKRDQYSGAWSKDKIALACLPSGAIIDVSVKEFTMIDPDTQESRQIIPVTPVKRRVSVNVSANTKQVRLMPIEPDELIPLESVISWRLVTLNLKPQYKE